VKKLRVTIDGSTFLIEIDPRQHGSERTVRVDGVERRVSLVPTRPEVAAWILVDGRSHEVGVDADLTLLRDAAGLHRIEVRDLGAPVGRPTSGDGRVKAPIPGLVARVLVGPGAHVTAGQPLLILEAMKMENPIGSPRAGTVREVRVKAGQRVALGELLVEVQPG